jgi:hypothetical protein
MIQAQVLLATYFFRNNCLLQAEVCANGAAILALECKLHEIRSSRVSNSVLLDVVLPIDAIEEGERIRGFWAVAFLHTSLGLTFGSHRAFCLLDSPGADIDTPWPLEIADYEEGVFPPEYLGQESIRHLLMDDVFPASPICMLQAKATAFLHHVSRLPCKFNPLPQSIN